MQDYKNINFHCANEGRLRGEKNKIIEVFPGPICCGGRQEAWDQNIGNKIFFKSSNLIPSLRVLQ